MLCAVCVVPCLITRCQDWKPRLPDNKTCVSTRHLGAKTRWQETCLITRLLDAKTRWQDFLEHFQTPIPLPLHVIMMHVCVKMANLAQRCAAMALCNGSALEAAGVNASNVCKLGSNEQVDSINCRNMSGHQGHSVALKCWSCNCNAEHQGN